MFGRLFSSYNPSDGPAGNYDRNYFPKDFTADIERYRDMEGMRCPEIHSSHRYSDYSVMSDAELNYYFWWRTNIRRGEVILADYGYAWLYACELINSKEDPKEILGKILDFTELCGRSLRMAPLVRGLAEDYVLARGLSRGMLPDKGDFVYSDGYDTWALTRYPMRKASFGFVVPQGTCKWFDMGIDADQIHEVVGMSLAGIDEMTRSSEGKGLIRAIGCEPLATERFLFNEFADFTGTKPVIVPVVDNSDGPLFELLDGIIRTASKLMRTDGRSGPTIPKTFPKAYRMVVAAAVDAVVCGDPFDARTFRCASIEGNGFWMDDDLETELREMEIRPSIIPLNCPVKTIPNVMSRTLDSNRHLESEDPVEYVPSGHSMAYYDEMDDAQTAFYIHWRTLAKRGEFMSTDRGYLWLYVVELINDDDDPERVRHDLDALLDAYDPENIPESVRTASVDHSLLHGYDTNPLAVHRNTERYILFRKLEEDPIGDMNIHMAQAYAHYDSDKYTSDCTDVYEGAFTAAVRALDGYLLRKNGKRIRDYGNERMMTTTKRLYSGLWMPRFPVERFEFIDYCDSKRITVLMDGVLKHTIREVRKHLGMSYPKIPLEFRDEFVPVVVEAVRGYLHDLDEETDRARARKEVSSLILDRDAVASAVADLEAVRGMMSVEDTEEMTVEEVIVETAPEVTEGTVWEAFIASLDDIERTYLVQSLSDSGAGPVTLKGTGRRAGAVEDSINTKAMDSVGDTVVEDGHAIEDYIEDIREVL